MISSKMGEKVIYTETKDIINGLFDFGCSPCLQSSKNEQEMSHWILKIC